MDDNELRFFNSSVKIEKRAEGNEPETLVLRGHAAVFNSLSENLGGFREEIDAAAFDEVLDNDVRAVFNHDPNFILGRTKSGTLKLSVDGEGLRYEVTLPDTQTARDVAASVSRGDIDGSSFKFTVVEDDWREDDDGRVIRTVKKVGRLLDVGPVTFPAYPDASVAKRSLESFKNEKTCNDVVNKLRLELESKKHV